MVSVCQQRGVFRSSLGAGRGMEVAEKSARRGVSHFSARRVEMYNFPQSDPLLPALTRTSSGPALGPRPTPPRAAI